MYNKVVHLILSFLLLFSCIIHVSCDDYPPLQIQQDLRATTLGSQNQGNVNVWSSVAVYDASVATADFTAIELYALAQLAHDEMKADFVKPGSTVGKKRQPATMAAMAIANLVYFSSSIKSKTNYIMDLKKNDVINQKLNQCMATLEAKRELQSGQIKKHMNNAQCGEITCLQMQRLDTMPKPNWDTTPKKAIVAYGPSDDPNFRGDVPKACCGETGDLTIWGCAAFMAQEGLTTYPTPAPGTPLVLPAAKPLSSRFVGLC